MQRRSPANMESSSLEIPSLDCIEHSQSGNQLLLGGADPLVRLCDPPSDQNAIELAESYRFQGNDQQRNAILTLLKMAETRFSSGAEEGRSAGGF